MANKVIEQWIKSDPKLKEMSEYTLFRPTEELSSFSFGDYVEINGEKINVNFLKKVLTDYEYFEYAYKYFNDEIPKFNVSSIVAGEVDETISFKKLNIIKAIEYLVYTKKITLNAAQDKKFDELKNVISYENFLQKCNGVVKNITIDGNHYLIRVSDILRFLTSNEKEYEKMCNSNEFCFISGVPREYFIYAVCDFIKKQEIFDKYFVPSVIVERYNELKSSSNVDIEAVNKYLKVSDDRFEKITLANKLTREVFNTIPRRSVIEQALYVYIKLCRVLDYDEEYKYPKRNIEYIETVTKTNNKVIKDEFNLIYSRFLCMLGINFKNDYFNNGDSEIKFRVGKFLLSCDFNEETLKNDFESCKEDKAFHSLTCINQNENTKKEFSRLVNRVYSDIKYVENMEKQKLYVDDNTKFIYPYSKNRNKKPVCLSEKFTNFINKVKTSGKEGKDALHYMMQFKNLCFTTSELSNNINIYLIKNNSILSSDAGNLCAVITLNSADINRRPEFNTYYVFDEKLKLYPTTSEHISEIISTGEFEIFNKVDENKNNLYKKY